jgi:hypothetical protein
LAFLNYETTHKTFPPGYVSNFTSDGDDTGPGWGWCSFILPQMEESAIYRVIHFDLPIEDPMNGVRVANIPGLFCPTDDVKRVWPAKSRDANGNPIALICGVPPQTMSACTALQNRALMAMECSFATARLH